MPKQMPAILAGTMQSNGTPPLDVCLGAAANSPRSDCGDKLNGLLRQNLEKNDRLLSKNDNRLGHVTSLHLSSFRPVPGR